MAFSPKWALSLVTKKYLALLCGLLLLSAQAATLEHEAEHEHADHEHQVSCDAFILYSSSGIACSGIELPNIPWGYHAFAIVSLVLLLLKTLPSSYCIRASPSVLLLIDPQ